MKITLPSLLLIYVIGTCCGYSQTTQANPPSETCEPAMDQVSWVKDNNITRFDLAPLGNKIKAVLTFIPGGVTPYLSGEFELASYTKTGCCDPSDTNQTTLTKDEVSGTGGIGVDTGRLPIPGLSLPAGVGGAYIGASTDISLNLTGSVEDTCSANRSDLCASVTLSHNISIYGGANVWGDALDVRLTGTGTIQGGAEWCKSSGWDPQNVCGSANATLSITTFELTFWEQEIGSVTTCE